MLKDAGNDSTKKAAAVNTIAESISRINKVEDFTRKQDYIKKSAELLKIDETGLLTLVNKLTGERISKQEDRFQQPAAQPSADMPPPEVGYDESVEFFNLDIKHERALACLLLEFGLLPWDETTSVAQHVFAEIDEWGMIEDADLLHLCNTFREAYNNGAEPTLKGFLFHEDQSISKQVVALADFGDELSPNWIRIYEKPFPTKEDLYIQELHSVLTYLKLRKIKKMIDENQRDMELPHNDDEMITLIKTHQHLKQLEMDLTKAMGTVIFR